MNKRKTKQHQLGQYMTTDDVAKEMCKLFLTAKDKWVVFDPSCGDGALLEAAAKCLLDFGVPIDRIELLGFDIDDEMIERAKARFKNAFEKVIKKLDLRQCNTLHVLNGDVFLQDERKLLENVNIVIGNPPYGKGMEVKFFDACDSFFSRKAELVFLLPMSFADAIHGINYHMLKGRPLGVTTGHVIVHHNCGNIYTKKSQKEALTEVQGFSVLTGVKLYERGAGSPPQDDEIMRTKPYSSDVENPQWIPCLRTGDVQKFGYTKTRLWVKYGDHLAHPKELSRFVGPRIFVRRVPIWACKSLGAAYIEETALCAGDVLVVRHMNDDVQHLKGLCVFLNSPEAAEFIISNRPSVGYRDSFPKISAKDLVRLLCARIPSDIDLKRLSEDFK